MHRRGWEGAAPKSDAASDAVDRASVPRLRFCFFFFSQIHANLGRFAPTRLDSRRIGFDLRRTGLIQPESGRISHIGQYQPATDTADTAETCRNRPKQAEIGLENRRRGRNSDLKCVSCLILSLFCESSILMCFLRIF